MSTEQSERTQHEVVVHKAAIPLMKGESLDTFISAVKSAAREHITQKYNLDIKKGSVYPIEVFADKAVFKVIPDYDLPPGNDFIVALKFDRGTSTGQFSFTQTMKVIPVTSFVPDDGMKPAEITKAMGMDAWTVDRVFAGVL